MEFRRLSLDFTVSRKLTRSYRRDVGRGTLLEIHMSPLRVSALINYVPLSVTASALTRTIDSTCRPVTRGGSSGIQRGCVRSRVGSFTDLFCHAALVPAYRFLNPATKRTPRPRTCTLHLFDRPHTRRSNEPATNRRRF